MTEFNFKKIDAFATANSDGNPAGYIRLKKMEFMTAKQMQKIAKELKGYVNEVGFVTQREFDEFDIKYYSSEREVDFCGHATIAIFYDLFLNDDELIKLSKLKINTNRGQLEVHNKIESDNAVFIMSPVPESKELLPARSELIKYLNIKKEGFHVDLPTSVINAGLTTLIVPIANLDTVLKINPDFDRLNQFCQTYELDIILVFSIEVSDKHSDFRTRVFAPTFGYLEDPATGSGNSALGYYLINHHLWKKENLIIEQNGSMTNFNTVKLLKDITDGTVRVFFGGGAITRIEGKYRLY